VKVETTLEIAAPPEEVFDLLMDPRRLGEWVTAHRSVRAVPDGPLRKGSSFTQRLRLARVEFNVEWKLVRIERPTLAEWSGDGPRGTGAHVIYRLEPNGDGTTFHYLNELKLPGGPAGIAAGKLASKPAEQAMKHSLKKLQKVFD
jgi:carbon monoxide dehydrogenase subunit G